MISELATQIAGVEIIENGHELVTLKKEDFVLDPKYFEWQYSDSEEMQLREGALNALGHAQRLLRERKGELWNFKVWDCYRTLRTQQLLFEEYSRELREKHPEWSDQAIEDATRVFVAVPSFDPKKPSPHNTGGAVDLTIVDVEGEEIDMGTKFDEFIDKAHTNFFDGSQIEKEMEIHQNRMLLKDVMEEAGFVNYSEEWWHFSFGDQAWAYAKDKPHAIYGSKEI